MTLDAAVLYKTRYIENLRRQSGAINRERIKYLSDELATMKATQTEVNRLKTELETTKQKYLGLLEIYETAEKLESFYSNLLIKTLSQNGKARCNNSNRKPESAGSAARQHAGHGSRH